MASLAPDCGWIAPEEQISIFCDGACSRNGKPDSKAAYGMVVFRGTTTVLHRYSVALSAEEPQTNQRAELRALFHSIDYAASLGDECRGVTIYSDSKYAIDCIKTWGPNWEARGWRKADKKEPIIHLDIIKPMYELWQTVKLRCALLHVRGHTGRGDFISMGNKIADELATAPLSS
jgi:ribonuclease HI